MVPCILIDPSARTLTLSPGKPLPEWLGSYWHSVTPLDIGELLTSQRRLRRHRPFPPGFRLPDWTRPKDGGVFERRYDGRGYVVPKDGVSIEKALEVLTKDVTWRP